MLRSLLTLSQKACTTGAKSIRITNGYHFRGSMQLSYSTITSWPLSPNLKDLEVKATTGSVEDILKLGKIHFEEQRRDEAELWLSKAASNDSIEAQFMAGMLLITPPPVTTPISAEKEASNKAEVREQIMKLRKESMFAKRSQTTNLDDFQAALKKRKEKLVLQQQPQATAVPVEVKLPPVSPSTVLTKDLDRRALGLEWLQRAALGGHGQAMCLLGNELLSESQKILNGEPSKEKKVPDVAHAEQLLHQAISWYQLAATEGKVGAAAYNLGVMYHDGVQHSLPLSTLAKTPAPADALAPVSSLSDLMVTKVVNKKGAAPVEVTHPATSVVASTSASTNTTDGTPASPPNQLVTVVPVDLEASFSFFQQAAALGEAAASLWCGYCYCTGEGGVTEIDAEKALNYLLEAANSLNANQVIDGITEKESDVQTAAKANYYLSQIFLSGLDEQLDPDRAKSLHYLQLAVAGHDEDAVHTLADLHLQRHLTLESQLASTHITADNEADEEETEVGEEVEKLEVDFLEKDLLQALQQEASAVATRNAFSGSASHVHSESCGSACGHDHHQHHDHHNHHNHDHDHSHSHHHDQHPHNSEQQDHAPMDLSVKDLPLPTTGAEWSKQHLLRAVRLFVQASAAGQDQATLTLGALTYQGLLPPQRDEEGNVIDNKRRAFELYQLAAEQGSLDAWRNLASMHYLGDGVPKSVDLAKEIMKVVFGKK